MTGQVMYIGGREEVYMKFWFECTTKRCHFSEKDIDRLIWKQNLWN